MATFKKIKFECKIGTEAVGIKYSMCNLICEKLSVNDKIVIKNTEKKKNMKIKDIFFTWNSFYKMI